MSVLPGPSVDSGDLEAVMPGAGVLALALGPCAHPVPVGLPVLPAPAERPTVVEVEPAPVHAGGGDGGARGGRVGHGGHGGGGGHCSVCVLAGPSPAIFVVSSSHMSVLEGPDLLEAELGPVRASEDKNTLTETETVPASPNIQPGLAGTFSQQEWRLRLCWVCWVTLLDYIPPPLHLSHRRDHSRSHSQMSPSSPSSYDPVP